MSFRNIALQLFYIPINVSLLCVCVCFFLWVRAGVVLQSVDQLNHCNELWNYISCDWNEAFLSHCLRAIHTLLTFYAFVFSPTESNWQQYSFFHVFRLHSPRFLLQLLVQKAFTVIHSFIHSAVCLTTGPTPFPKPALHIVRSRASSFSCEYPLLSLTFWHRNLAFKFYHTLYVKCYLYRNQKL
jgi:hypothetical protein